jgi:hypothetical protein
MAVDDTRLDDARIAEADQCEFDGGKFEENRTSLTVFVTLNLFIKLSAIFIKILRFALYKI